MYRIERAEGGVLRVSFRGTVSVEEAEAAVAGAHQAAMRDPAAGLMLCFEGARLPSPAALAAGLGSSPHLRPLAAMLGRVAVVTDQPMIRALARAQSALIRRVEMRDFSRAREDEALAFLAGPR